jgi:hypothetical protein
MAMIIVSLVFGSSITAFVIKKINENLNTEISVKSAEFSIFKRFPHAAVVFSDVVIKPNKDFKASNSLSADLIRSKHIYVEINILKILFKDYSIKRIVAEDGELNLIVNDDGIQNFDIFKKTQNKEGEKSAAINLYGIVLKSFKYRYFDVPHSVDLSGFAKKVNLEGVIDGNKYDFRIAADVKSHHLIIRNIEYLKNRSLEAELVFKRTSDIYNIETSKLNIEGIDLSTKMIFTTSANAEIDLITKASEVNLSGFQRLIPDEYQKYVSNFESKGKTSLVLSVKGKMYGNFFPHVELNFSLKNGSILQTKTNIKVTGVNCEGSYSNGARNTPASSVFYINNFSSELERGTISGDFKYANFDSPELSVNMKTVIDLGNIRKFLAIDTIENLEGKLKAEISLVAGFNTPTFKRENIRSFRISGNANLSEAQLKLKNSNYLYNEINSQIILGNDFQFENLAFKIDNNDFFIRGRLFDAVPYLLKQTRTINLKAELRSQSLDLSKYFEKDPKKISSDKYDASMLFPEDLLAELNVSISNFTLKRFHARNVIARVNYKPGMYTLNSAVFETMQGRVSGNGAVMQDLSKNLVVKGQTSLKKIDIKQLFYAFNNFGQSILRDNHLKGSLSGDILVSCEWDSKMNLNYNNVLVESNLEIANGELIDFEPLLGLSKFISLAELRDIKFSTLKNQIFIRHQQIIIPQMDINSSAFNISGSGIHNFDNHYTYRINVLLSEVLARKARQNKKENDEFGVVEDDGLGKTRIPLLIVGFNNDYKISYDTKGLKQIVKESLQNQKKELKSIFKEEFGMFKNDSTVSKSKSSGKFNIEWDEKPEAEKKQVEQPVKKKKKTFEEEGFKVEFDE